jgi:RNA polymerase sigma factor (sigma-70 family)
MNTPVEPQTPFDRDFAEIYKTHYRRVFSLCRYLLNSVDAAEDAAHEVFLRAQRKLATYDPSLPFSSWLSGIASNYCIDILRRRTTEKRIFDVDAGPDADPPAAGRTTRRTDCQRTWPRRPPCAQRATGKVPRAAGFGLLQRNELRRNCGRTWPCPKQCCNLDFPREAAVAGEAGAAAKRFEEK